MLSFASFPLCVEQELQDLQANCPVGCRLLQADDLETWIIAVSVLGESVYAGEEFALVRFLLRAAQARAALVLGSDFVLQRFRFSPQYPIDVRTQLPKSDKL